MLLIAVCVPGALADYESTWDPYVLRGPVDGAP